MKQTRNALVLGMLGIAFMSLKVHAQCPVAALHETAQDCPWAEAARATQGKTDATELRKILDQDAPGFMQEIDRDADSPHLLSLWGLSSNVDESNLANGTRTVPANLLQFFVSIWKVPYNSDFTIGHAGINHTYGYLFSSVYTPFGFKRARYVQGELESGFGLSAGLFSGVPSQGTLLSNISYFAGKIAFRDSANSKEDFERAEWKGDLVYVPELADYAYCDLKIQRLVEVVKNKDFYLELRTDIVNFPKNNTQGSDQALLVYSVDYHAVGEPSRPRLITAFPVQTSFAAGIFNPNGLGDEVPLKLKYNAALPVTIPAALMVGKRFIANESNSTRN